MQAPLSKEMQLRYRTRLTYQDSDRRCGKRGSSWTTTLSAMCPRENWTSGSRVGRNPVQTETARTAGALLAAAHAVGQPEPLCS